MIENFLNKKNSTRDLSDEEYEKKLSILAEELEQVSFYNKHSEDILKNDWSKLCKWETDLNIIASTNRIGMKLCEHFFPNFYDIENKNGKSFSKLWVKENLEKVLSWNRKSHSTPYMSELKRGIYFNCGLPKSTMYRPQMAKMIVSSLKSKSVLDPCAGWGGRLLGTVSSGAKYVGFEPNTKTHKHLKELCEFLNIEDKVILICDDALNMDKYDIGTFDLVLTSPPYFNLEVYCNEKTQSIQNSDNYDLWLENFLNPLVNKSLSKLNKNGWSCWNVHNIGKMKMIDDIKNIHSTFKNIKEFFVVSSIRQVNNQKNKSKDLTRCFQNSEKKA